MIKLSNHTINNIFLCVIFTVLLTNCQRVSMQETDIPDSERSISATKIINRSTSTVEESRFITETVVPTQTTRPTRTSTLIPTSTWTPLPTLSEQAAKKQIDQLLTDNGGCELPCVWGLVPKETSWFEAEQFLQSFMKIKYQGEGTPLKGVLVAFEYKRKENLERQSIQLRVENYQVTGFWLSPPTTKIRYRLDQILARYGKPEEIYITTYPYSRVKDILPFDMILYYPEYGFSALFNYNAKNTGDHLWVCPTSQPISPDLRIWDPQTEVSLKEVYPDYFPGGRAKLSVDKALGIDIGQFTNEFRKDDTTNCFVTLNELWE